MNRNTQLALYDRIQVHRNNRQGTDQAAASMRIPVVVPRLPVGVATPSVWFAPTMAGLIP